MKLSLIAAIVSLMTIPTFAKYEVIYPVKDVNFITKTQSPVEPPIVPPVDPPEPECQFVYGGTTEWILYAKKLMIILTMVIEFCGKDRLFLIPCMATLQNQG